MNNVRSQNTVDAEPQNPRAFAVVSSTQQNVMENNWTDEQLIAAMQHESPNIQALDTFIERYWKPLFAWCYMMTVNRHQAFQLGQKTWQHILGAPQLVHSTEDFCTQLVTLATDLWRDQIPADEAETAIETCPGSPFHLSPGAVKEAEISFPYTTPENLHILSKAERTELTRIVDLALGRTTPKQRDILLNSLQSNFRVATTSLGLREE
jgi:DNA-directed RNA polymerase specialized sigma24 family protein